MNNENENLITGYFHIPKAFISKIVDNLKLLKLLLKDEISIEYEIMPENRKITKYLPLSNIDFEVKHGAAYLKNS
ncbi:MAG: hypothetical protein HeimC3_07470 [Candidatus Heimdallarchaeota archaeon LC_3]|nr:MAG: hypothetical protein HeimC3_07470 [Candidatus Heimdallarchaeota archaeon LC_3]